MKISIQKRMGGKCQPVLQAGFLALIDSKDIAEKAAAIASGRLDEEARKRVKESLPAMVVQASFKDGVRKNENAILNPLVMVDLDHLDEEVDAVWGGIAPRAEALGIRMAYKTISTHGLRLVMDWREGLATIEQNQRFLVEQIGMGRYWDSHCVDPARLSFLVPHSYFYKLDDIFDPEEAVPAWFVPIREGYGKVQAPCANTTTAASTTPINVPESTQTAYHGIPLRDIVGVMMDYFGGLPSEGDRNNRYFAIASEIRNITDYNPLAIFNVLKEGCTLSDSELMAVCSSACRYRSKPVISERLQDAIDLCAAQQEAEEVELMNFEVNFPLPPVFSHFYAAAPEDFRNATVLALLPIMGTLASKIRTPYHGRMEHPSFQCVLEAPQGAGKSFLADLVKRCLKPVIEQDEKNIQRQKVFDEELKATKLAGGGKTKAERQELKELLANRPNDPIRITPAIISITKLLMLLDNAQGAHLFQYSPEISILVDSFKRSFSNISNLLKVSFDGEKYGQSYASDTSFSGSVDAFFNTLWSGTPNSVANFFTDGKVEDGTTSRTIFITLPDQSFKPLQTFKPFTAAQEAEIDAALEHLNSYTMDGDDVKGEYVMDLAWLGSEIDKWNEAQRLYAKKTNDITRDTFRRRAAAYGLRAAMLAWVLYDEKDTRTIRKNVKAFGCWVASMALAGLLRRVTLAPRASLVNFFGSAAYNDLPDEFDREELQRALIDNHLTSPTHRVIYKWVELGVIERNQKYGSSHYRKIQPAA